MGVLYICFHSSAVVFWCSLLNADSFGWSASRYRSLASFIGWAAMTSFLHMCRSSLISALQENWKGRQVKNIITEGVYTVEYT